MIGAGGIGFDVSELLTVDESPTLNLKEWKAEWGIAADRQEGAAGWLVPLIPPPARDVFRCSTSRALGPRARQDHRLGTGRR